VLRFTLRQDPWWRLLACADGPSGRDVDCRVHVGVGQMSAGNTPEDRLALAVLRRAIPTGAAGLRRVRRFDFLDSSNGLVLQADDQFAPSVGQDASRQARLCAPPVRQIRTWPIGVGDGFGATGHLHDAQVFHADEVEASGEVGADLLHPVLAAVAGTSVQLGDRVLRPPATVGAATTACESALQPLESIPLAVREARAGQEFAGAQCCGDGDAAVHADDLACAGCGDRLRDRCEGDVPAAGPIAGDAVRLRIRNGARQSQPDPANFGHVDFGPLPVPFGYPRSLETNDAEPFAMAGFTPARTPVGSADEVLHRLLEVAQCLLLNSLRPGSQPVERGSRLSQLTALRSKAWRRPLPAGPHRPLFKSQVPDVPRMLALFKQCSFLRGSRVEPEPGHAIYPISQDRQFPVLEGRQSRFVPTLETGAAPRQLR